MPNQFVDHKDRWLILSENTDFEFALLFIKLWIPFNAWYCNNYPRHNNSDAPILHELKTDNNLFRTRIISYLNGQDNDAIHFRKLLGDLHQSLEKFLIPDPSNRISFTNIYFRENPNMIVNKFYRGFDYQAELLRHPSGKIAGAKLIAIERITRANKLSYSHSSYDKSHLNSDPDYNRLSSNKKTIAESIFLAVNPKLKENVISLVKRNSIVCGATLFHGDADNLSKAVIQILYRLRCVLFHGEMQPSKDNLSVFEPAYLILRLLIKSLK